MKKLIAPIVLLALGTGSGIGTALYLKEEPSELADGHAIECSAPAVEEVLEDALTAPDPDEVVSAEYAKLENQFVVPIVTDEKISALVVMTITVEVPTGGKDIVLLTEPKLRDRFLDVLFEHANLGGFSGNFTSSSNMRALRGDLLAAARRVVGMNARDILILDIVRQDS